jgi:hypothetical protein
MEALMPIRVFLEILVSLSALLLTPILAYSHGGGLDAYGCHNDRKDGEYHCHKGQFDGQTFASKQDMLQTLEGLTRPAPKQPEPTTVLMEPAEPGEKVCIRENKTKQVVCGEVVR